MSAGDEALAGRIVQAVLSELHDRSGIGDELDMLEDDPETLADMTAALNDAVLKELRR